MFGVLLHLKHKNKVVNIDRTEGFFSSPNFKRNDPVWYIDCSKTNEMADIGIQGPRDSTSIG